MSFGGGDDTRGSAATPAPALAEEMPARGSAGSSMGGRRREARPGPGEPGSPGPDGGAQLAPAAASPRAERAAGDCPGRGTLKTVSPVGLVPSLCRLCALGGCPGAACDAPRLGAETDGPPFCDRNHAAWFLGCTFLRRREIRDWFYGSRRRSRNM